MHALAFVCTAGPASASDIGTASQIDRAEISRAVRKWGAANLIAREDDERHRKRRIIRPTAAGKRLFRKIRDLRWSYFRALMEDLSSADRHQLNAMLEKVARRLMMQSVGGTRGSRARSAPWNHSPKSPWPSQNSNVASTP